MAYIDGEARTEEEARGVKTLFWQMYKQHQDDQIRLPGIGAFLSGLTNLRVRRLRAVFELFFGDKPGWV